MDLLARALQFASTLETLTQSCFGPNGLAVLMETADGHTMCSNCGLWLINSLSLSHPAGSTISNAVRKHCRATGDGSKKMILILAAAFRELHHQLCSPTSRKTIHLIEVSQALMWLHLKLTQDILPPIWSQVGASVNASGAARTPDFRLLLTRILHTHLKPNHPLVRHMFISGLSETLVDDSVLQSISHLKKRVEYLQDMLKKVSIHIPGVSVSETRFFPGFLIEGDLIPTANDLQESKSFKMILLKASLVWDETTDNAVDPSLSLSSLGKLRCLMDYFTQRLKTAVETMAKEGIKLLLCGGKISPVAQQLLEESSISAISMVPEEVLVSMAETSKSYPYSSIKSLMCDLDGRACSFLQGQSCRCLSVGKRRFVHVRTPPGCVCRNRDVSKQSPYSLLVCAPTVGYCRQLSQDISNMLQVLHSWCRKEEIGGESCLLAVAGGGAWEIAVIRALEKHLSSGQVAHGSAHWIALKTLQKGLLSVPQTLYTSSLSHRFTGKLAMDFYHKVHAKEATLGVDTVLGCLRPVDENWSTWEPYHSQAMLLQSVLVLMAQLLRMDQVLPAQQT